MQRLWNNFTKKACNDVVSIERTYTKINEKNLDKDGNDATRVEKTDKLEREAAQKVVDYLNCKRNEQKLNEENFPLPKSDYNPHKDILEQLVYASLVSYSYTKDSGLLIKEPVRDEKIGITRLGNLIKGVGFGRKQYYDSWHKKGSEIGDEEIKVKFTFDFSKLLQDNSLLKSWQNRVLGITPPEAHRDENYNSTGHADQVNMRGLMEEYEAGLRRYPAGTTGTGGSTGSRKSTRRRRSNTRIIKQKKRKSNKNHSGRRKTIRK
jgi:hypothetical protein